MPRMRTLTALAPLTLALLALGCEGIPASETLQNENRQLHGVIRSQEKRIDDLISQIDELDSQLRLLDYVFDDVEPPMFPDTLVVVESLTPTLVASPMLTPTVLESYSDGSGKSEGE